jgi:putative spermidine/putrescine transport system permease protein
MKGTTTVGRHGLEAIVVRVVAIVLLAMLLSPILVVIVMSFTAAETLEFPPPGLSLRWYEDVLALLTGPGAGIARLGESLVASLMIATATAAVCLVASVPAAYALVRYRFRGRAALEELLGLPVVFPTVVLGVALLMLLSLTGIDLGIWQIVIAHAIVCLPFMMRNAMAAIGGIDPSLQEAARTLGASAPRAFVEVVLPLARQGLVSGALIVFVISFNEFTLAYFLYTIDVFPLSIWLFQQSNTSFSPAIFAVSTLTVVITVVIIVGVDLLAGRRRNPAP